MYKPYFEPRELTFLAAVLECACREAGIVEDSERELAAARIVGLAQTGEEDFDALSKRVRLAASFRLIECRGPAEMRLRRNMPWQFLA
ncbi:hypothetical protein [Taklimakanibacter albus]|uniref:Uncharacterized protein n=1 Tax=Taklimakanibacter albus TaxID=2800327 RepID=A0ACC5RCZ5_9HYPH|nr:hypothetical protein [Aestuariivirga sp. YIM B02566]MBK1870545.1 hypothetical protein [Aestuariivirga sp. YIM B02566]